MYNKNIWNTLVSKSCSMLKTFIKALAPPISIVMGIQGFKIGRCRVRLFRHTKEKILIVPQPLTILSESPQYF